jgi:diacylglycerol O-acyltransferase
VLNPPTTNARRSVATVGLPLSGLRQLGKSFGDATVNDVVLAVVSGAMRGHLLERGALPDESLVAMLPVSLRSAEEGADTGVLVSILLADLATRFDDPVERLRWIVGSTRDGKARLRKLSKEAAQGYPVMTLLPAILSSQLGFMHRIPMPFNFVVSNVPGPREALYDYGARLEAIYPISSLWDRMGINFTMMSYLDALNFGIIATDAVPDLRGLVDRIEPEFALLSDALA